MRISDWSSDVYSSDLLAGHRAQRLAKGEVIGDGDHLLLLLRIARAPLDEALARNPRDFNRRLADRRDPRPAMLRDREAAEPDQRPFGRDRQEIGRTSWGERGGRYV